MTEQPNEFERLADEDRESIVTEFYHFLRDNKKWWLIPIIVVLGAVGILAWMTAGGAAPFIYTIF